LALVGVVGAAFIGLAQPAADWIERAPHVLQQIDMKARDIKEPIEALKRAAEEVEKTANVGPASPAMTVSGRGLLERAFGGAIHALTQCAVVVILLIFLLSFGDMFKEKLVRVMPTMTEKKRAVQIWREIEHDMSRYLFTMTLINFGYGAIVGVCLHFVGLPNPALWGVMAALLNYIPYFGPLIGITVLFVVGVVTFDRIELAFVPPAILGAVNFVEGSFVTPNILGRRFEMNPVVIFMAVTFWGWIWGVPGALMAVPILVSFKVLCDHIERLRNVGEFLGR
jgi:predicted PurR-regulated permease PerM